jgi:hypothetical protein
VVRRKLAELKHLEKNARYMRSVEFSQLVANLERDGVLTSLPLIHRDVIISGNHRVQAARKAGIVEADVLEIVGDVDDARLKAIQLSHNAIAGKDDPNVLADLYGALPFDEKLYSGVTDDVLKELEELPCPGVSAAATQYTDFLLTFLPEEADAFITLVKRMEKKALADAVLVASGRDFDHFFDTLVSVKEKRNVHNLATAMRTMATLAAERLEQIDREAEASAQAAGAPDGVTDGGEVGDAA